MHKTPWYSLLLIVTFSSTSFAMEQQKDCTQRWGQLVAALPQLTTIEQRPVPKYGMHSGTTWFDAHKEGAYQQALTSPDPEVSLKAVAMPIVFERSDIKDGKSIIRKSSYRFPLAHFARGILLLDEGNVHEAEHEFKEAERSVGQYNPHEAPILHASAFARFLLNNQYDQAFGQLTQLQKIIKVYPSWQSVVGIQRQMLLDVEYLPAIAQLAQEGSVDARYQVVQAACQEAAKQKTVEAQYSAVMPLTEYLTSLDEHPEFRPYVEAMRLYTTAATAYHDKQHPQASQKLVELLEHPQNDIALNHIYKLSEQLLEAVAQVGDLRAQCYLIEKQLQSTNTKMCTKGINAAGRILRKFMQTSDVDQAQIVEQSSMLRSIEYLAKQNNNVASAIYAEWLCNQALALASMPEYAAQFKALSKEIKKYAQAGISASQNESVLLEKIIQYVDALVAYHDNKLELAAQKLLEIQNDPKKKKGLNKKIHTQTAELLSDLALKGEWQARCWVNDVACLRDGKDLSKGNVLSCCQLATDLLAHAPKQVVEGAQATKLFEHVRTLANNGNAQASYLASRFLFRTCHAGRESTGLSSTESTLLDDAFKCACMASKAGIDDAKKLAKAIMLYTSVQKLTEQGKADLAVDPALQLLALDLGGPETALCHTFARLQLTVRAVQGNITACAWYVRELFESGKQEDLQAALAGCDQAFSKFIEYDFDNTPLETWRAKLTPFQTNKIMEKLEYVFQTSDDVSVKSQAAYVLSVCHLIQGVTEYPVIVCEQLPTKEDALGNALKLAKQSLALSCQSKAAQDMINRYLKMVGTCCFFLGCHAMQIHKITDGLAILREGAHLNNPHCMRALACGQLELDSDQQKIDKAEFDAHIAMLDEAFRLGDMVAGALLAHHYFDGPALPFKCGYALERDMPKAYEYAKATCSSAFAHSLRIVGFIDCCAALKNSKRKEAQKVIAHGIQLLAQSCKAGCVEAYAHLVEISKWSICNSENGKTIADFMMSQAKEHVPVAMCALGTILLAKPEQIDIDLAISYFHQAIKISNGEFGHYEMVELFCSNPEKYMQGADLFKVADHCMALLNSTDDIRTLGSKSLDFFGKVILKLHMFKGTDQQQAQAARYYQQLVERLDKIGVNVSKQMMSLEDVMQATTTDQVRVVAAAESKQDSASTGIVGTTQQPVLLSENFVQGLAGIDAAFEDMHGKCAQAILQDVVVFDALEAGAQQENALSCYLLSKLYMHNAEHDVGMRKDIDLLKACTMQAVVTAGKALQTDFTNKRYARQLTQANLQAFNFYCTVLIPYYGYDQEQFDAVMELAKQVITMQDMPGIAPNDGKKMVRAATQCVHALACRGYMPALAMYTAKHLHSTHKDQQDAALEALYLNALQFCSKVHGDTVRRDAFKELLITHIAYIKELADTNNNGSAALVMSSCHTFRGKYVLQSPEQKSKSEESAWHYCEQAKNLGNKRAVSLWYEHALLGDTPISAAECTKALKVLSGIMDQELSAAELLMEVYASGGSLPCGQTVPKNKKLSKKIALKIQDQSFLALELLCLFAQEEQEHKKAILYKLEILKRTRNVRENGLLELSQNCAVAQIYPDEVITYLEQKAQEGRLDAVVALAGIAIKRKDFDRGLLLINQVIEKGDVLQQGSAHLELAFAYIDQDWSEFNIAKGIEHLETGIKTVALEEVDKDSTTSGVQAFAMILIKLMFNSLMKHDQVVKEDTSKALEKLVDLMQEHRLYDTQSVDWPLILLTMQCMIGSDYWILRRYVVDALAMLQVSKTHSGDLEYIGYAVSIVLSRLQVDALALQKEGNTQRAQQLSKNIQDLLALIKKDKVIYAIVFPIAIKH